MVNFLRQLVKQIADDNVTIAEDALSSAEFTGYIDTGSYILNAQISGSLYGGVPNTKYLVLAGEQAVGKTFFALGIVKNFLDSDPNNQAVWFLAERAVTRKMLTDRGIDASRVAFFEPDTVLHWATLTIKALDIYMETPEDKRPKMMMVLDSLGALATEKSIEDLTSGDYKRDMTQQQNIKLAVKILEKKLARSKVPLIVTNHVYQMITSYVPTKELSGGSGLKYFMDCCAFLTSAKEKEDKEVTGHIITSHMYKNRFAKPHTKVSVKLSYDTGLNRYYGLIDLGSKYGIFKKEGNRWRVGDEVAFEKAIYKDPKKYFTEEIMARLEEAARREFEYGKHNDELIDEDDNQQSDSE